jgi:high affinity sulfate transporter 1
MVRSYQRRWLKNDLVAGLVLAALLVPQGMAYAELARLPAITGLYTTILCLLAYAIFGPSRVLVLGPDSSLGPMIAATITPLVAANGDPARAVAYASMLALMVGVITVLTGAFKLGFIADLLSKPTQIGYMNGLALTIVVGQLPKFFGFSIDGQGLIDEAKKFISAVGAGETVLAALAVGVASLAVILAFDRWLPRVPGVLIAVVGAIAAVSIWDLADHGVKVVGTLPQGLPPFTIPSVPLGDLGLLLAGAAGIALVSLTDTISTASAFASRRGDDVDGNQEMIGIGAANLAAGLFQGFPVSTSGSRTAVATQNRAKSQVTGLVGAATVLLLLVFFPSLLRNLPQPTLAAVVIAASLSLADIAGMRRLWRQRRSDFWVGVTAFLGVALLGVLPGIGVAIAISILDVFRRAWRPYRATLGRVPNIDGFHDVTSYPEAELLPGLVMYRFDGPVFFANNTLFRNEIRQIAESEPHPKWIVIAAEPITDIDTTAADMLAELDIRVNAMGCSLVFAEMKDPVRAKVMRFELDKTLTTEHFFPTLDDAVEAYQQETGVRWPSEVPAAEPAPTREGPA